MNCYWLTILLLPTLSLAESPPDPAAQATPPPQIRNGLIEVNRIAATVNGLTITAKEVGVMLAPEIGRLMAEFPRRGPEFERQLQAGKDRILQELIDRQLIMSEFSKRQKEGANLPPRVVDQEITRQINTLYNGNTEAFREELAKARMTMASYRELTKEKLVVQAMRAEKFSDAPPPIPSEVREEFQEAKDSLRDTTQDVISFRKIFLPRFDASNPLATAETQLALAENLAEKLRSGADFGELAGKYSQDAYAADGGLQNEVPRTDLSPEFAAILFDAEEGKIIGPLEDPVGFTICRVEKFKKGPAPPLDEVRPLIEERVRAKKTSERYESWIGELRDQAMIDIKVK